MEILTDMCSNITNLYIIIVTTALIKTLIKEIQNHICAYMLWEMSVMFATLVISHLGLIPSIGGHLCDGCNLHDLKGATRSRVP